MSNKFTRGLPFNITVGCCHRLFEVYSGFKVGTKDRGIQTDKISRGTYTNKTENLTIS